ncbi:MAG: Ankyrin repeats (3 copies) [Alphaproteobacteria bacterium ADurb.Bin438]|nr:MAG: Ankyrin repeats (3 copies) [Alphaproteobacteria bacterium ADurb.Bin438]
MLASKTDNPKNIEVLINAKAEVNVVDNNNLTPLVAAARFNKNPEIIKVLAKNGADVNAKTTQGKTPLMLAVSNENSLEIIKALIEVGADINEKDDAGNDLLNNIITNSPDRSDIIEILIKNKVNLTNSDRNGFTPFLIAVFKDSDTKVLKTLVDAGANINLTNKFGENALDIAVKHSSKPENVKFLIDLGLKINEKNRKGMTPIMTASAYNTNPEIVKTLIQNGAKIEDKNDNEETPLMLAVLNNANIKVVRELIEAGADVNAVNRRGETILTLAKRMNKVEFANAIFSAGGTLTATKAKLLSDLDKKLFDALSKSETTLEEIKNIVKSGANVNAQMLYSVTPLMVASANTKDEAVIKFLLDNKANPVSKSDDEEDALMYAAKKSNNPLVIKTLIEYGANIATYDKGGNSALMLASINNKNPKIIDALVKGGSDVNRKNKAGFPSLSLATLNNNIDAINALVSNEATIDIKINDGSTPLINAVKSDNIKSDVAEVLLHLGANPHLKDKTGKSALDYAKSNPNFKDTNAYKTMIAMPSGATLEALNKTLLLLVRNDKTNRGQIEAIVKAGANINATNSDEFLTYVSALNDIDGEVVKNILKVGGLNDADKSVIYNSAKPDSDNAFLKDLTKGKLNVSETLSTPLMLASMYVKDLDAIDFLIKNGADMERKDIYNNTALIYAAAYGSPETVKALLRAGANKSIKNIYDMSALDYARKRNEMTSVLDLL